ncbi:hypothetical protein IFR04_013373 [Cadophora malorum]|uniref:2EXR domain-containing protein n=1 Tax=Cadophora malorum TaxID=108018 RepID=A0A8H7T772_9HELO|nr:hypothetical protein IFR04_013373 [Cadophora malorum]
MVTLSSPTTPSSIPPDTPPLTLSSLVSTETSPAKLEETSLRIEKLQFMLKHLQNLKKQIEASEREPGTATTFPKFSKLPVELRLKVFQEVLFTQEIFAIGWEMFRDVNGNLEDWRDPGWDDERPRIGSWLDFKVQALQITSKASLLGVNAEARTEALKFLRIFELHGKHTWFNVDVDTAWLPRFNRWDGEMRDEGFLVDHQLQRVKLRYKSWVEPLNEGIPYTTSNIYRQFGEKGLRGLVLTLGIKDFCLTAGKKSITKDTQPSDFYYFQDSANAVDDKISWQMLEQEEIERMRDWNNERLKDREYLGTGKYCHGSDGHPTLTIYRATRYRVTGLDYRRVG